MTEEFQETVRKTVLEHGKAVHRPDVGEFVFELPGDAFDSIAGFLGRWEHEGVPCIHLGRVRILREAGYWDKLEVAHRERVSTQPIDS